MTTNMPPDATWALCCAHKRSVDDGRLRFVQVTREGIKITLRRDKSLYAWWVNGREAGYWLPGDSYGYNNASLTGVVQRDGAPVR